MGLLNWLRDSLAGPSPCNKRLPFEPDPPGPASFLPKPPPDVAAAINRQLDREIARRRGSNPPAPGSKPVAPAEMPSDQQMERWKKAAIDKYLNGGEHTWRTAALLAFAEGRRRAQSLQLPPPGAEPVATDEDLIVVATGPVWTHRRYRAIYARGRADERTAILRALGVQP
jgi:hypothetical protein